MKLLYRVKLGGEGRNLAWLQAGHTPVTDWDVVFQVYMYILGLDSVLLNYGNV